jgi:hypothetical protein
MSPQKGVQYILTGTGHWRWRNPRGRIPQHQGVLSESLALWETLSGGLWQVLIALLRISHKQASDPRAQH